MAMTILVLSTIAAAPWTNSATDAEITPASPFPDDDAKTAWIVFAINPAGSVASVEAASTAVSSTPRRANRCDSRLRAFVNRLSSVHSFSPKRRAASARLKFSRQQRIKTLR